MEIFKKPKRSLIIALCAGAAALVLGIVLFFLLQPKNIGFYGVDLEDPAIVRLQKQLKENGYTVCIADTLEDMKKLDCKAWVVSADTDGLARQITDRVGSKAIFVGRKPAIPCRYVGLDFAQAGEILSGLLLALPGKGDVNEDGATACVIVTPSNSPQDVQAWESSLLAACDAAAHPILILDPCTGENTVDGSKAAVANALAKYGKDLEVIFTFSDQMAEGAALAIADGGWKLSEDHYLLTNSSQKDMDTVLQLYSGAAYADVKAQADLYYRAIMDCIDGKQAADYILPFEAVS